MNQKDYTAVAALTNRDFNLPKAGYAVTPEAIRAIAKGIDKTESHPVIQRARYHLERRRKRKS